MAGRLSAQQILPGYRSADLNEQGVAVSTTPVQVWTNEDGLQGALASLVVTGGTDGSVFNIIVDGVTITFSLKTNTPFGLSFNHGTEVYVSKTKKVQPSGGISFSSTASVFVDYRLRILG